jgi:2-oxoisovalerate dehydrogenase E1 component alpha subunit
MSRQWRGLQRTTSSIFVSGLRLKSSNSSASTVEKVSFPGAIDGSLYTQKLAFLRDYPTIPTYRVLNLDGEVLEPKEDPQLPKETLRKMYTSMLTLNTMDLILYDAQRQGRISFYMTSYGEEATHMGTAAALKSDDVIYGYSCVNVQHKTRFLMHQLTCCQTIP